MPEYVLIILQGHCDSCPFAPVECPYDGCNIVKYGSSSLCRHKLACPFRPVLCDCGREMPQNERRVRKLVHENVDR